MSHKVLMAAFLSLAWTVPAGAQTHPTTIPKVFTGTYAGTTNAYPFARTYGYFQTWYRGDSLKVPSPIFQLGYRAGQTTTAAAQKLKLAIVLSSSSATFSSLSKTFATNHGKDRIVFYKLKTLNLPAVAPTNTPDVPALWIRGDVPFIFKGPNLVVDIDIQETATATSTSYRSDAYTSAASKFFKVEKSCGTGALAGSYTAPTLQFSLTGAPAMKPTLFLIGTRNQSLAGTIPLPLDLSPLGMTGCVLGVDPILVIASTTNGSGAASIKGPISLGSTTAIIFAQCIHASTATPAGFATTNMVNALLGTQGLSTYLYCWSTVGPTATSGPYTTNRGPVLMIRP